ncbi:MAG: cholest-4-en-3-one 26-monooxygenase [Actinomycetota bacterium]|nr:cholest-4-en-3-one 26-monooxygenase [Actinomycetota bacterium]
MTVVGDTVDVLSPEVYLDGPPWERLAWLRANAPVYDHRLDDPLLVDRCWVVSRHDDVRAVSRDPATFSSADGIHLRRTATHHFRPNMINMDDPDHSRVRKLVSGGFTPRVVRAFERHYADLARGVVDKALANGGAFDGVRDVAAELPLLAICEVLGAPEADRFRIFGWSNTLLSSEDPEYAPTPEAFQESVMAMVAYAGELAERRRREPGDDLVSALLGPDGDLPLTDAEFEGLVLLLLAAGNETTRNAIAHGLHAFAAHPDQWDVLRSDPAATLDTAVEEMIRWASPVNYMSRTATSDVDVQGQKIRAGDKVALLYASANRDEAAFAAPERFDVRRDPNHHLAFGFGPHFCLGATLARIELRALLEAMVPGIASLELTAPVRRVRSSFLNGLKDLPLRAIPA